MQSGNVNAQSSYSVALPASAEWTRVEVPLESFSGANPADLSSLIRIKFFLQNTASGIVYLDDLGLARVQSIPGIPGWSLY